MANCSPWKFKQNLFHKVKLNKGQAAERLAADYLKNQGLSFVERNYRCRRGEIDLIFKQDDTWVFVEVKYRTSKNYGGAAAAVDQHKIHRILLSAQHYLQNYNINQYDTAIRFDVITVQEQAPYLEWFQNAFGE